MSYDQTPEMLAYVNQPWTFVPKPKKRRGVRQQKAPRGTRKALNGRKDG